MTPLQRYILQTLAPALDADILCESLTDWLHADTLARFHRYGVSFRPLLVELVQFLSDGTLANFVEYLAAEEADLSQGLGRPLTWGRVNYRRSWRVPMCPCLRVSETWRGAHCHVPLPGWRQRIFVQHRWTVKRHETADRILS